jgi:hypothetical protein
LNRLLPELPGPPSLCGRESVLHGRGPARPTCPCTRFAAWNRVKGFAAWNRRMAAHGRIEKARRQSVPCCKPLYTPTRWQPMASGFPTAHRACLRDPFKAEQSLAVTLNPMLLAHCSDCTSSSDAQARFLTFPERHFADQTVQYLSVWTAATAHTRKRSLLSRQVFNKVM